MRLTIRLVMLAVVSVLLCGTVWADGMFIPKEELDKWRQEWKQKVITEPDQKAIICFHDGIENLIISPKYQGSAQEFAWIVPVPSRPDVQIDSPAIFDELVDLASRWWHVKGTIPGDKPEEPKPPVRLLERKILGDYDVSVLAADDPNALMNWLHDNGYQVPDKALAPIKAYVKDRWRFVACKVVNNDARTTDELHTGSLAPLLLTFYTDRPVYPLRLSSINPEPFDLMIYMLLPKPMAPDYGHIIHPERRTFGTYVPSLNRGRHQFGPDGILNPPEDRYKYPRLSRFYKGAMELFVCEYTLGRPWRRVKPEQCKADIYWNLWLY